jgi:hypothetical protein
MLERVSLKSGQPVTMPSGRSAVVGELKRFGVSFVYTDTDGGEVTLTRRVVRRLFP